MGTLFVVATPIGNLEDITLRALRVLAEVDLILAEDTRRTRVLLDRHGVRGKLVSLNAHNEAARTRRVLDALVGEGGVALVSDAGTPLVSDPGERLVAAARQAGYRVEPVPGASAALAALSASGLPVARFVFLGFLPRRGGPRRRMLEAWVERPETLVIYESPNRLAATLRDLRDVLGPRRGCVARELTKLHEEIVTEPLDRLIERFSGDVRGEVTVLVEGADEVRVPPPPEQLDAAIRERIAAGCSPKQVAAELAPETGVPKRELYARAVAMREGT
jgi:16S rRNA (cytidine1402-2'-O)-methyltransferase